MSYPDAPRRGATCRSARLRRNALCGKILGQGAPCCGTYRRGRASHEDGILRRGLDMGYAVTSLAEGNAVNLCDPLLREGTGGENLIKQHKAQHTSGFAPAADRRLLIRCGWVCTPPPIG